MINKIIKKCRSCFSDQLVEVISLGNLYLSDFIKNNKKIPKSPLTLLLCTNCHLLQLKHTTKASILYTENYGYKSGINQTMQDELKEITIKAYKKVQKKEKKLFIVDIGANDGTLLKYYPKIGTYKVGIEPISKFAKECKKYANVVINDFFRYSSYKKYLDGKKADIITVISCFYDMDNPNKFLSDINKIIKDDGILIIQQNYLKSMLEQNAFDNIVHEHLEYYSLLSLSNLLKKHGFEVFDVELKKLNGGSFRTYIAKKDKRKISNSVYKLLQLEKKLKLNNIATYKNFAVRIKNSKKDIKDFISNEVKKGKKIYVYGASTRGNTLLQYFGLDRKTIPFAVERNPEKWGKKIASVGIPIISEEEARKHKPDYMIVLPWFFKEEFLKRERNYLSAGGHFIFPLPKINVV